MEILIYQNMITDGHERQLTPNELKLYVELRMRILSYTARVETSLDILSKKVVFSKTPKKNKVLVKELLESLVQKGYITMEDSDGVLDIEFVYYEANAQEEGYYDLVPLVVYESARNAQELMILCFVYRFQKAFGQTRMTFENAGKLLGVTTPTALSLIDNMVSSGLLVKFQGDRKEGSKHREPNSYYIPFIGKTKTEPVKKALKVVEPVKTKQPTKQNQVGLDSIMSRIKKQRP